MLLNSGDHMQQTVYDDDGDGGTKYTQTQSEVIMIIQILVLLNFQAQHCVCNMILFVLTIWRDLRLRKGLIPITVFFFFF